MRRLIDRVGGRLLAVLLPQINAAACVIPDCHNEFFCGSNHHLFRRSCCRDPECNLSCSAWTDTRVAC